MTRRRPQTTRGRTFPPEILSDDEIRRLLAGCSSTAPIGIRNHALVAVMYRSGLRISEALDLRPKDIDPRNGALRVLHGKGDRPRTVGLDPGAMSLVRGWLEVRADLGLNGSSPVFCTLAGPSGGGGRMTDKGRHADEGGSTFYRDLAMMILGILLVGAAVFFLLFLLADDSDPVITTSVDPASTTTVAESTSTSGGSTSSTSSSPSTTTSTTTVPVRPPQDVRVVVLNSIAVDGAAGRMTNQLDDAGYQTLPPDDFEPEQDPSRLWYREGFSTEANELLQFIPDALVEPLEDDGLQLGADIVIILGTGYDE